MNTELLPRLRKEVETERDEASPSSRSWAPTRTARRSQPIEGIDDDFADSAAATARAQRRRSRSSTAPASAWSEAEEALARMDAGEYGICVDCGKPIPWRAWRPARCRSAAWTAPPPRARIAQGAPGRPDRPQARRR